MFFNDSVPFVPSKSPGLAACLFLAVLFVLGMMIECSAAEKGQEDPSSDRKNETLITAQQMSADQDQGIITATGRVEIARNGYLLHADKVIFNQNTGVMHAQGHVAVLTPSGEVEFSELEEITGDMKQAFADNVAILFPDNSRFIGRNVQRYEGRYTVAENANYTACNLCKEDPDASPLWQLRGREAVHDNVEHDIYYHDATIDFMGVPVLYTPYFSAPDPTVDRRQGFLTTTPGFSSNIGPFIKVPYYFDIAPNADATVTPMYSQKDGPQLGLEYRRRFDEGYMQFDGSFTHADLIDEIGVNKGQQWRGHLFGSAVYNLSNQWRTGSDIAFASDKSYFGRYAITSQDQLSNRVYAEGFKGRDYTVVNSYLFDDLRAGKQVLQPLVLPQSSFSLFGEPGKTWGGRWSLGGSELVTTRDNANEPLWQQGPNTRHVSLNGGWERKLISDYGIETTISGLLRGDAYSADNVQDQRNQGVVYNHVLLGRQFEQANAVMSYPFVRNGDGYQHMISPIVAVTAAPNVHMSAKQPIEDSLDVQFDETNLFSPNRFTGTDLIEGGNRATYGMRQSVVTDSGGRLELFGGQSFSTSRNMGFSNISGLNNHSSDYVGRFDFVPVDWFSLNYGLRLNYSDYKPQSQDANIMIGPPIFRASMRYINAYQTDTTGTLDKVHEITGRISSNFMKYYTFTAAHTQAFTPDPGPRGTSATLNYADECFIYGVTANRTDTSRADLSSGFSVVFHIFLKNLGGAHTDSYSSPQFNTQFRQTE